MRQDKWGRDNDRAVNGELERRGEDERQQSREADRQQEVESKGGGSRW